MGTPFRASTENWPPAARLSPEHGSDFEPGIARRDLLTGFQPHAVRDDESALAMDGHAAARCGDDRADLLAPDLRQRPRRALLALEQEQAPAARRSPGPRRWVAAADQVEGDVDVVRPLDAGFRLADDAP